MEDVETAKYPAGTVNLPKMLHATGLAPSRSEAERLIKSGAVTVDGEKQTTLALEVAAGAVRTVRVGKKWKLIKGE